MYQVISIGMAIGGVMLAVIVVGLSACSILHYYRRAHHPPVQQEPEPDGWPENAQYEGDYYLYEGVYYQYEDDGGYPQNGDHHQYEGEEYPDQLEDS